MPAVGAASPGAATSHRRSDRCGFRRGPRADLGGARRRHATGAGAVPGRSGRGPGPLTGPPARPQPPSPRRRYPVAATPHLSLRAEPWAPRRRRWPTPRRSPRPPGRVSAIVGAPDAGAPGRRSASVSALHAQPGDPRRGDRRDGHRPAVARTVWSLVPPSGAPIALSADVVLLGRGPSPTRASPTRSSSRSRTARCRRPTRVWSCATTLVRHRPRLHQRRAVRDAHGHRGRGDAGRRDRGGRAVPAGGCRSAARCGATGSTDSTAPSRTRAPAEPRRSRPRDAASDDRSAAERTSVPTTSRAPTPRHETEDGSTVVARRESRRRLRRGRDHGREPGHPARRRPRPPARGIHRVAAARCAVPRRSSSPAPPTGGRHARRSVCVGTAQAPVDGAPPPASPAQSRRTALIVRRGIRGRPARRRRR